jgi:hypothetical protein
MTDLTPNQQWYRSLTDEERARYSQQSARRIDEYQRRTVLNNPFNQHRDWTEEEDNLLAWSDKLTVDLALLLHRTYYQTNRRRAQLRQQITNSVRPWIKVTQPYEDKGIVLCACATFDEDHESWCPNAR